VSGAKRPAKRAAPIVKSRAGPVGKPRAKRASPPAAQAVASRAAPTPVDLQIGARLKHARLLAGIRMRELAAKVGCTEGMVSKIENARVVPSLPMLQRLVEALGRNLPSFFGSNPDTPGLVLRAGQRPILVACKTSGKLPKSERTTLLEVADRCDAQPVLAQRPVKPNGLLEGGKVQTFTVLTNGVNFELDVLPIPRRAKP